MFHFENFKFLRETIDQSVSAGGVSPRDQIKSS